MNIWTGSASIAAASTSPVRAPLSPLRTLLRWHGLDHGWPPSGRGRAPLPSPLLPIANPWAKPLPPSLPPSLPPTVNGRPLPGFPAIGCQRPQPLYPLWGGGSLRLGARDRRLHLRAGGINLCRSRDVLVHECSLFQASAAGTNGLSTLGDNPFTLLGLDRWARRPTGNNDGNPGPSKLARPVEAQTHRVASKNRQGKDVGPAKPKLNWSPSATVRTTTLGPQNEGSSEIPSRGDDSAAMDQLQQDGHSDEATVSLLKAAIQRHASPSCGEGSSPMLESVPLSSGVTEVSCPGTGRDQDVAMDGTPDRV